MTRIRRAAELVYFVGLSAVVTLGGLGRSVGGIMLDWWEDWR